MKTNYFLSRLQKKLNLLAHSKSPKELTEIDIETAKSEFLDSLRSILAAESLRKLEKEIQRIGLSDASTKLCSKCQTLQPISNFYFTKDGTRMLEKCKLCAAQKWQSDKNLGQHFFSLSLYSAKRRAAAKRLPFDINSDYLKSIYPTDGKCPIFGITMKAGVRGNNDSAPSLDKIIPEKGYTKGNVWYISMRANRIKSDHSLEDIFIVAYAIQKKLTEIGTDNPIKSRLMN